MKKVFGFLKNTNVFMLLLVLAMALFGVTDVSMAVGVDGTDGVGKHVAGGETLNTEIIAQNSPDMLLPDIDDRITKISPYKNRIDQIARTVGRKMTAHGLEYKHYSIDIAPISDTLASALSEGTTVSSVLHVTNVDLFNETDTITVGGIKGYDEAGTTLTSEDLMLYVNGRVTDNSVEKLSVTAINGKLVNGKKVVPAIANGTEIFMLATAAAEGDMRSYTNSSLPTPETGYLQIFKIEVGESTIAQMSLKEVNWGLNDQIEFAVTKFRAMVERASLKGVKGKTTVPGKNVPIYTTGGIYWQINKSFDLPSKPTNGDLIDMAEYVFTGQSGSNQKVLLMGSKFNAAISKIETTKQQTATAVEEHFGVKWSMITTNFGVFAAAPYDMLDVLGMSNEAIVLDPDYIDKWTLVPFGSKAVDLKSAGIYDGDVNVTTEISSVCLRYNNAHCKLKIVETVPVTGITTSDSAETLAAGATWDFGSKLTVAPSTATNKALTFQTSNAAKATVDANGVVTAVATGSAVISAKTDDGNFSAVATITIS